MQKTQSKKEKKMDKSKLKIDKTSSDWFSKRRVSDSYAVDRAGNIISGVPPQYRKGDEFYGVDAKKVYVQGGTTIEGEDVIIEHPANDPNFPQNSSGWNEDEFGFVTNDAIVHPRNKSEKIGEINLGNQQVNQTVQSILNPVQDVAESTEDFLERGVYGFKMYQLIIVGLVALVIIK